VSDERLDLKARPDLMARIAEESGGAVLEGDDLREPRAVCSTTTGNEPARGR